MRQKCFVLKNYSVIQVESHQFLSYSSSIFLIILDRCINKFYSPAPHNEYSGYRCPFCSCHGYSCRSEGETAVRRLRDLPLLLRKRCFRLRNVPFSGVLEQALDDRCCVFGKVRLGDLVKPARGCPRVSGFGLETRSIRSVWDLSLRLDCGP